MVKAIVLYMSSTELESEWQEGNKQQNGITVKDNYKIWFSLVYAF